MTRIIYRNTFLMAVVGLLCLLFGQTTARADVLGWGWNAYGQLGDGTSTARFAPVQAVGLTNVAAISSGNEHTVALKQDGTVWAWGFGEYGQLGDGTFTTRLAPVQVIGLANVISVAACGHNNIALKSDGTVWTWGNGNYGQIGDGSTFNRGAPVQVTALSNIVSVDMGSAHCIAIRNDGTLWGWGLNVYGQLGDGTFVFQRNLPVQVIGLTGAVSVKCGGYHNLALMPNGTVQAWGENSLGQLGDGTTNMRSTPASVLGLTGITEVKGGSLHSLALDAGGNVWSWGYAAADQLYDPTTPDRWVPTLVSGITGVRSISAGTFHSLALMPDGAVQAWGSNAYGQLGDGTFTNSETPVTVLGIANAALISAGGEHSHTVVPNNRAPVANAGPDLSVNCCSSTNLSGSASSDPDGDALTYAWYEGTTQLSTAMSPSLSLSAGTHTLTLTVTDPAGESSSDTVLVTVEAMGFQGFLEPIGGADATGGSYTAPILNRKLGSTVPVKFRGSCCGNDVLTGIHTLQAIKYTSATASQTPINATSTDAATVGNQFRLTGNQWHFNLDTSFLSKGTWKLVATLSDGSTHFVWITLK